MARPFFLSGASTATCCQEAGAFKSIASGRCHAKHGNVVQSSAADLPATRTSEVARNSADCVRNTAMNTAEIINTCDHKFRAVGLGGLSSAERLVLLASWVNSEVERGGIGAFFHASAGAFAKETVDALIELGAMDEAAAVNQGRELLRNRSWQHLAVSGEFERLTDKFLASMPGLFERVAAFVETHAEELESTAQQGVAVTR
jgi:hypothetical protein